VEPVSAPARGAHLLACVFTAATEGRRGEDGAVEAPADAKEAAGEAASAAAKAAAAKAEDAKAIVSAFTDALEHMVRAFSYLKV